ncbi:Septin-domain-containing protein [Scenedesmus sp. NREL 46B-D3]|nr:Septin-domain-containing protein [Scenedesmus sp. NREL 46B-D3]
MAPSTTERKKGGSLMFSFGRSKAVKAKAASVNTAPFTPSDKPVKGSSIMSKAISNSSSAATASPKAALPKAAANAFTMNACIPLPPSAVSKRRPVPAEPAHEASTAMHLRRDDAAAAWQSRPRMPSRLMDTYVNFMVLGESGLGKTTFIQNLTSSFRIVNGGGVQDGSCTTLSQFQADPDSLRTVLEPMEIPESSRRLMISIQDMPGWGDDINLMRYMRIVTGFLLEQRAKDYERLAGGRTLDKTAMCGQLQHSITACLYFIPPHRTKKIDLILMAAISQLVTIIPVIGKSDAMTEAELTAYRAEVLQMLAQPNKFVAARNLPQLEVSLFSFAESVLTDLGMCKSQLPIAVVTSRDSEPCDDPAFLESLGLSDVQSPMQPVRYYRWGACYPLNRGHSDLIVLKRLLLGDRVEACTPCWTTPTHATQPSAVPLRQRQAAAAGGAGRMAGGWPSFGV